MKLSLQKTNFDNTKEKENLVKKPLIDFLKEDYKRGNRAPGFHPSEIYYMCEVQEAFKLIYPEIAPECNPRPFPGLLLNFGIGHAVHELIQNEYLGPAKILKGKWICSSCENIHKGLMPDNCETCGSYKIYYKEIKISDSDLDIVGHTDGIIVTDLGDITLDIKTIHNESYNMLCEPKEAHIWQINTYMKCLNHDIGVLLYVNKDRQFDRYSQKPNIKEFKVERTEKIWNKIKTKINRIKNIRKIFNKFGEEKLRKIMPKFKYPCKSKSYWKARDCPFSEECFKIRKE